MSQERTSTLCPKFEQAMSFLGKKWNGLIIESLCVGPLRFGELRDNIEGISDRVLTERLHELMDLDIVSKSKEDYNGRKVTRYSLTHKGAQLQGCLNAIHKWADHYVEMEQMI